MGPVRNDIVNRNRIGLVYYGIAARALMGRKQDYHVYSIVYVYHSHVSHCVYNIIPSTDSASLYCNQRTTNMEGGRRPYIQGPHG